MRVVSGRGWTMVCADSLAWLADQPSSRRFGAVITDPPYSSGGLHRSDRTTPAHTKYVRTGAAIRGVSFDGDARDQWSYFGWVALWLAHAYRLARVSAPVCIFSDWRQLAVTMSALQAGGFVLRGVAPWCKTRPRPRMGGFAQSAEFVAWGSRGALPARTSVGVLEGHWLVPTVHFRRREHITQKPDELLERIVRIAPPRAEVLDPFAGGGSTGVGCIRSGRRFLGIESNPKIFALACRRLRAAERTAA